jgi:tRNA modification GTPase
LDGSQELSSDDEELIARLAEKKIIVVINKCDLPRKLNLRAVEAGLKAAPLINCSCLDNSGIDMLEESIVRLISHGKIEVPEESVLSTPRQKKIVQNTLKSVEEAISACHQNASAEFVAQHVRVGMQELGALVGEVVTDEVLEALFSQFCIGK